MCRRTRIPGKGDLSVVLARLEAEDAEAVDDFAGVDPQDSGHVGEVILAEAEYPLERLAALGLDPGEVAGQ